MKRVFLTKTHELKKAAVCMLREDLMHCVSRDQGSRASSKIYVWEREKLGSEIDDLECNKLEVSEYNKKGFDPCLLFEQTGVQVEEKQGYATALGLIYD